MPEPFRRAPTVAPDLSAQTIAIALEGWGSYPPAGVPWTFGFHGGLLELFEPHDAGLLRLWTAHALFLKAAARSWLAAALCRSGRPPAVFRGSARLGTRARHDGRA
jgi:hypothetical protein